MTEEDRDQMSSSAEEDQEEEQESSGEESEEEEDQEDEVDLDSDEEVSTVYWVCTLRSRPFFYPQLQEAFAAGLIKPGLNTEFVARPKKEQVNDVEGLDRKTEEIRLKLPWLERLDLVCKPAPLAPELAYKEDQHQKEREKALQQANAGQKKAKGKKGGRSPKALALADDPVHNDFLREMLFYRQAQAGVLEALPRLRSMGLPTKRPDDYFAQMAKTDQHMQKVRLMLLQSFFEYFQHVVVQNKN